jgi:hypothetical protein
MIVYVLSRISTYDYFFVLDGIFGLCFVSPTYARVFHK